MLLKDCITNPDLISARPLQRTTPEQEWVIARAAGFLPDSVFQLYSEANYLSFGSAPPFLRDDDNVLFSYFGLVLRAVMESLQDADEQVKAFREAQKQTYDPAKRLRGETWDPSADLRARRHFRDMLTALQTVLDSLADIIAIFWTGCITGLIVGRAQFAKIEGWLRQPLPKPSDMLISPSDFYLEQLHEALLPVVGAAPPEKDWLPLMRLLRNKAAHLGQPLFRMMCLHDATGHFYCFLPRRWPLLWERNIKPVGTRVTTPASQLIQQELMHQDIISFAEGLQAKVLELVGAGTSVLCSAFEQFKNFSCNAAALSELEKSSEEYGFEYFVRP